MSRRADVISMAYDPPARYHFKRGCLTAHREIIIQPAPGTGSGGVPHGVTQWLRSSVKRIGSAFTRRVLRGT